MSVECGSIGKVCQLERGHAAAAALFIPFGGVKMFALRSYRPNRSMGQVANLPGRRQMGNLAHVGWLAVAAVAALAGTLRADDDSAAAVEKRLAGVARYLSCDELEGRGLGSAGLEKAADFIAAQFARGRPENRSVRGRPLPTFFRGDPRRVGNQ